MEYFRESDPDFAVLDCKSGQKKIMNRLYFGDCEFYLPEILHKGVWSGYCFNENEWGCLQFDLSGEWSELENGSFISLEYDGTYLPYTKALALTDTYICIYSEASSSIVWYDRKTGKRIQQQLLLGNDSGSNLGYSTICINEMTSDGDWVYLHDTYNNCIYSCNSKTGFGPTIRLDDCYPYLDYRNLVAYQGKVQLLQTSTSQIAVYEDGTFQGWVLPEDVGAQSIESFDIGFEEIVVNDVQAGWVYSLPFDTLGKKKKVN